MAFQDRAESLAERLHLGRVPRPAFVAIALALALMIALAACAFAMTPGGGFEVKAKGAADAEALAVADSGSKDSAEGESDGGEAGSDPSAENVPLSVGDNGEAKRVCVHVDGCVATPGVYYLEAGSRVIDAVTAAGGATDEARTDAVNLAQEVQDGQQIVIPSASQGEATSSGAVAAPSPGSQGAGDGSSSAGTDGLVNINTATAEEFETLKGVGAATAEKIVADREANGPFTSIDDLTRVSGIGEKKLAAMRDRLCL